MPAQLLLASQSPRRRQLLEALGVAFTTLSTDIDETPAPGEAPGHLATRLATGKAQAAASRLPAATARLILASDTVVAQSDELLGKPEDEDDARRMLTQLRGTVHHVYTAVCLLHHPHGAQQQRLNVTRVVMRNYTDGEMLAYIATGDPFDKAGAYAIQAAEFAPVAQLDGCYASVMGFPLGDVADLLQEAGLLIPPAVGPLCRQRSGPAFDCCRDADL